MALFNRLASFIVPAAVLAACTLSGTVALADEGMWTFDNFPAASVKSRLGVTVDAAFLNHVQ